MGSLLGKSAAEVRRAELEKDLERFLANGGEIKVIAPDLPRSAGKKVSGNSIEEEAEQKSEESDEKLEELWDQT